MNIELATDCRGKLAHGGGYGKRRANTHGVSWLYFCMHRHAGGLRTCLGCYEVALIKDPRKVLNWADDFASCHPVGHSPDGQNYMILTTNQMRLLRIIASDHTIRPSRLADRLGCFASNISRLLRQLEQLELIERPARRGDQVTSGILLTPAGEEVVRQQNSQAVAMLDELIGSFDERDLNFLEASLQRAQFRSEAPARAAALNKVLKA